MNKVIEQYTPVSFPGPHPASRCLEYTKQWEAGRGPGKLSLNSKLKHHWSEECFAKLLIREWSIALTFSVKHMLIYGSSYTTFNYTLCVELISMWGDSVWTYYVSLLVCYLIASPDWLIYFVEHITTWYKLWKFASWQSVNRTWSQKFR